MTEEIEFILDSTKESMTGSIAHLEKEFWYSDANKRLQQTRLLVGLVVI